MADFTPLMAVPGSEVFSSRALPMDELRAKISPKVRLHEPSGSETIDPLTYEVVRHRVWSVTDEMGETLKKMSGSPGVTESNDFDFAVCDELGQEVQVGLYNTGLVASIDLAIYWILQHRSDNPGIKPGDMFINNDPWVGGGLHQNDTAILAPFFWDGELFGWTSAVCHLIDVGGAKPGSSDLAATSAFTEGPCTPPTKIVRDGELQADVLEAFTRGSRMPTLINFDIRAMIAANNVGHARLRRLIEEYGPDVVKRVMKNMMDDAEKRLRNRLAGIPDGSWSSTGYMEQASIGDRGIHKIELTMTKIEDRLVFDFTGTDPQVGMINCPYAGMRAGVTFAMLPLLCGDIPWSAGGLMRCFELISEEGTINNASYPAAVGWAPVTAGWATSNLVSQCLSQMLDTTVETRERVQSCCTGSFDVVTLAGLDQHGNPSVSLMIDCMAGGYGARPNNDGADTAGILPIQMGRSPDVEMQELVAPLLILWRREEIDSGGPGRQRGGLSISDCVIPYGTPAPLAGAFNSNGKARAEAGGLAGGYPGGAGRDYIVRGSSAKRLLEAGSIPQSLEQLEGQVEIVGNRVETLIGLDDAIIIHPGGGGGYGDPLLREPEAVALDLGIGRVSPGVARSIYGVVVDQNCVVDIDGTKKRREEIRRERGASGSSDLLVNVLDTANGTPIDDNLIVVRDGQSSTVLCRQCGSKVGDDVSDYHSGLTSRETDIRDCGNPAYNDPVDYVDSAMVLRQLSCPQCGTAMWTEVGPPQPLPAAGVASLDLIDAVRVGVGE